MDDQAVFEAIATQYFGVFHQAFQSLKGSVKGSEERVKWAIQENPKILEKAWRVYHAANWIDAYQELGKKFAAAPAGFSDLWKEYDQVYRKTVTASILYGINRQDGAESVVLFDAMVWYYTGEKGSPIPPDADKWDDPDINYDEWVLRATATGDPPEHMFGDEFIPGIHDPVALVETAVDYFAGQEWKADDQEYFEQSKQVGGGVGLPAGCGGTGQQRNLAAVEHGAFCSAATSGG